MIERYSREKMAEVWNLQTKYEAWWAVELAALEAMEELGIVPKGVCEDVKEKPVEINPARIEEIEQTTKHDVIAFLTHIEEMIGRQARWVHFGMTSSDVLDTAFALQLKKASGIILDDIDRLLLAVKDRAYEHKFTPMIGRSHGIHAEPITFGLVLTLWYAELSRQRARFSRAADNVAVGMISGAVGTFAHIPPKVEALVCDRLGLTPEPVSNQIIQRDRHGEYFSALALLASTIEKIAVEIRHMQRTEVHEAEEAFSKGQKGSSAMPHKRNPIGSENLSGLSRVVRANAIAAMENIPLWHERDISHSSVERVIAPDSTILTDYMLARLTRMIKNLVVFPESMMKNLNQMRGLVYSQTILLMLIAKELPRQKSYEMVQRNAMKVWEDETLDLKTALIADEELMAHLSEEEVLSAFDASYHQKHVDEIFERVFSEGK